MHLHSHGGSFFSLDQGTISLTQTRELYTTARQCQVFFFHALFCVRCSWCVCARCLPVCGKCRRQRAAMVCVALTRDHESRRGKVPPCGGSCPDALPGPTGLGGGKPHGEGRRPSRRGGIPTRWTAHCTGRQGFRRSWSRVSAKPTSIGHAETIASAKIMSSHHPDLPRTLRQDSGGEQSVYRSMAKLRSS